MFNKTSTLPLSGLSRINYYVLLLQILLRAIIKKLYNKLTDPPSLPLPFYSHPIPHLIPCTTEHPRQDSADTEQNTASHTAGAGHILKGQDLPTVPVENTWNNDPIYGQF